MNEVVFDCHGVSIRGSHFFSEQENLRNARGLPCIVMAHGLGLTFHALCIDYRYFGKSGGEPRQHFSVRAQLQDYAAAINYARELPEVVAVIAMTTKRSERTSSLRYWPTITILRTTTVIRAKFALRPSARKYFKQSFILSVMAPERGGAVSGRTGADETLQEGSALGAVKTLNRIASGLMPMRMCFNRPVSN